MRKPIGRLIAVGLFNILFLGWAFVSSSASSLGSTEVKAVMWLSRGQSMTKDIETAFVDMVKKRSNGELTIKIIGGPEVIPKMEMAQACSDGIIDMVFATVNDYRQIIPEVAAIHLSPSTPWGDRTNGIYDYWFNLHKKHNLYYLGRWNYNMNFVFHLRKKLIKNLADLKGLKISPTGRTDKLVEALGAVNVAITAGDLYSSLEKGLLDGYIWSESGRLRSWAEVTKYVIEEPILSAATFTTYMNLKKFDSLPKPLQDVLTRVSAEYEPVMAKYFADLRDAEKEQWKAAGVSFIKLPPDEAKWIAETAPKLSWELVKEMVGPESYDRLRKVLLLQ